MGDAPPTEEILHVSLRRNITFELSGAALPRPVEREARNELERFVRFH